MSVDRWWNNHKTADRVHTCLFQWERGRWFGYWMEAQISTAKCKEVNLLAAERNARRVLMDMENVEAGRLVERGLSFRAFIEAMVMEPNIPPTAVNPWSEIVGPPHCRGHVVMYVFNRTYEDHVKLPHLDMYNTIKRMAISGLSKHEIHRITGVQVLDIALALSIGK